QIVIAIDKGVLRMRWMSAREYARLQGAEGFPLVENNIQNLFGFGDAVCVPVVEWIDKNVLTPLFDFATSPKGDRLGRQSDAGTTTPNDAGSQRAEYVA